MNLNRYNYTHSILQMDISHKSFHGRFVSLFTHKNFDSKYGKIF